MSNKKIVVVIIMTALSLNSAFSQYAGIEFTIGSGFPLYQEKSFPEKNLERTYNQVCQSIHRPGYYTKGNPNFLLGIMVGFKFNEKWTIKAGVNYVHYSINAWANKDSALKYTVPECKDPFVSELDRFNKLNMPIGISHSIGRFEVGIYYSVPIVQGANSLINTVQGVEISSRSKNEWFYKIHNDTRNDYLQTDLTYKLSSRLKLSVNYLFNDIRKLNHLGLSLKITI